MGKSQSNGGGTNLASCILATFFLILLLIAAFTVYFILFKPKNPKLAVNAVRLPVFSAVNSTIVSFNFTQYVTVNNPNRAVFTHYDSSLQLLYAGNRVGLLFVPAGKIAAGRTKYMTATFSVQSLSVSDSGQPDNTGGLRAGPIMDVPGRISGQPDNVSGLNGFGGFRAGPSMEVETILEMAGRVRVLRFFTHHVEAKVDCRVVIVVSDGSVLGLRC